ncbi:hypothetical protein AWB78_08708 [Caballeronia calidae]|uniref:Uncharacterized protein n=1 Tax=Caballeronia calidae TaxID=1777139 RepID=A0A158EP56_9BURK|nr:hypothetical protein AWB78_08708 [Caballeronia calidae]
MCGISFSMNHVMTSTSTQVTMATITGALGLFAAAAPIAALKKYNSKPNTAANSTVTKP